VLGGNHHGRATGQRNAKIIPVRNKLKRRCRVEKMFRNMNRLWPRQF
jgi:hypothetical protein